MSSCSSNHRGNTSASLRTIARTKDGFSSGDPIWSSGWRNSSVHISPDTLVGSL